MSGVCIDLWRLISDTLKISYEYKVYPSTDTLMHDLRAGAIDLSILPLTATSERLAKLKLSIPFYISNMGIATQIEKQSAFVQLIKNIFSWKIIRSLLFIALIATVFAVFLWLAERKGNAQQGRRVSTGIQKRGGVHSGPYEGEREAPLQDRRAGEIAANFRSGCRGYR